MFFFEQRRLFKGVENARSLLFAGAAIASVTAGGLALEQSDVFAEKETPKISKLSDDIPVTRTVQDVEQALTRLFGDKIPVTQVIVRQTENKGTPTKGKTMLAQGGKAQTGKGSSRNPQIAQVLKTPPVLEQIDPPKKPVETREAQSSLVSIADLGLHPDTTKTLASLSEMQTGSGLNQTIRFGAGNEYTLALSQTPSKTGVNQSLSLEYRSGRDFAKVGLVSAIRTSEDGSVTMPAVLSLVSDHSHGIAPDALARVLTKLQVVNDGEGKISIPNATALIGFSEQGKIISGVGTGIGFVTRHQEVNASTTNPLGQTPTAFDKAFKSNAEESPLVTALKERSLAQDVKVDSVGATSKVSISGVELRGIFEHHMVQKTLPWASQEAQKSSENSAQLQLLTRYFSGEVLHTTNGVYDRSATLYLPYGVNLTGGHFGDPSFRQNHFGITLSEVDGKPFANLQTGDLEQGSRGHKVSMGGTLPTGHILSVSGDQLHRDWSDRTDRGLGVNVQQQEAWGTWGADLRAGTESSQILAKIGFPLWGELSPKNPQVSLEQGFNPLEQDGFNRNTTQLNKAPESRRQDILDAWIRLDTQYVKTLKPELEALKYQAPEFTGAILSLIHDIEEDEKAVANAVKDNADFENAVKSALAKVPEYQKRLNAIKPFEVPKNIETLEATRGNVTQIALLFDQRISEYLATSQDKDKISQAEKAIAELRLGLENPLVQNLLKHAFGQVHGRAITQGTFSDIVYAFSGKRSETLPLSVRNSLSQQDSHTLELADVLKSLLLQPLYAESVTQSLAQSLAVSIDPSFYGIGFYKDLQNLSELRFQSLGNSPQTVWEQSKKYVISKKQYFSPAKLEEYMQKRALYTIQNQGLVSVSTIQEATAVKVGNEIVEIQTLSGLWNALSVRGGEVLKEPLVKKYYYEVPEDTRKFQAGTSGVFATTGSLIPVMRRDITDKDFKLRTEKFLEDHTKALKIQREEVIVAAMPPMPDWLPYALGVGGAGGLAAALSSSGSSNGGPSSSPASNPAGTGITTCAVNSNVVGCNFTVTPSNPAYSVTWAAPVTHPLGANTAGNTFTLKDETVGVNNDIPDQTFIVTATVQNNALPPANIGQPLKWQMTITAEKVTAITRLQ